MKIVVHIERVVLDGVALPGGERRALWASLQTELERMLAAGTGMNQLRHGHALASVRGGDIRVRTGMNSKVIGKEIAGAVYGGLEKIR